MIMFKLYLKMFDTNLSSDEIRMKLLQNRIKFSDWYYEVKEISDTQYEFIPKVHSSLWKNSFPLKATLKVEDKENYNTIFLAFSIMKSVKIISLIIFLVGILFESIILTQAFIYKWDDFLPLLIAPLILLCLCLLLFGGCKISSFFILRKIKEVLQKNHN